MSTTETTALVRASAANRRIMLGGAALGLPVLLPARDFEQPVIGRSLLPIAQDGVGANNRLNLSEASGVAGIEIGMVRLGCLAERSPQAVGVIVRKCLKQIVERLHGSTTQIPIFPTSPPALALFN